ncbi:hypothetical protein AGDE_12474 [Angomonas deanei]|nr:hypothetical protein AGDE_12474 [Angomonas deanei]|eukprot:EPY24135.1 hypothetical protein AGDE_12474 [Angomonas deanei]
MAVFCDEENRLRAGKSISDLCTAGSLTVCLRYLKLASSRQLVFQQQNKYCIEKIVGEGSDSLVFRVKRYTDDLSEVLPQHLALKFVGAPNEAARSKWIKTVDQLKALRNYQPNLNIPLDLFINFNPVHFISSNPTDGNATSVVVGSASPPSASVVHQVPEGFWLKLEAKELLRHFTMNHDGELKENSLPRWYFCQVSEYYETNALTYLGNLAAFRNASVSKNEDFPLESVLCSVLYQTSSQLLLLSRETPALWHGNLKVSNLMVKNSTAKRHLGNTFFLPITLTDSGMSRWADYTLLERLTRYDESDDVLDPLARSSPGRDARDCFTGTKCGRLFIVERKPKHLCELLRTILQTPHFIAPERILVSFLKIPSLADLFLAPVETLLRSGAISVQLPLSRRLLRKHTQQQSNGGRQVASGHWFASKYLCSHKNDGPGNIDSRGAPTDAGEHANGASDLPLPPRKYYAGPPLFQGTRSNTVKEWRKQYAQQFAESQLRGENMHHLHNEQVTALEEEVAGEMQLPQENSGSFINLGATFNNYSEFFSVPSPSLSVSDHDRFPVDRSTYETSTPSETTCHTVTSVSAESSEMFLLMLSLLDKNRSSDDLWSLGVTLFELSVAAVPKTRAESANTSRTISASSLSVDALEALTTDLGTYRPEELTEGVKWQNSIAFEQSVLAYLTTLGCYSNQWTWMVSRLLSPVPSRRPGLEQILSTLRYQSSTEACDADPVLLDYTGDELHETCVLYLHHQND